MADNLDPRAAGAPVERMTALLGASGAINAGVATCQNFALAMALAETGAVDLMKVAAPEIRAAIETALKAYAAALRAMAAKPAAGGDDEAMRLPA